MQSFTFQPDHEELQRMAANLADLQRHISTHSELDPSVDSSPASATQAQQQLPHYQEDSPKGESLLISIKTQYEHHHPSHHLEENHEQKIERILQDPLTLTNSIDLFELLFYFREALQPDILDDLQLKLFNALLTALDHKNPKEVQTYAQTLALCGVENQQICQFMAEAMIEEYLDFQLSFLVLSNQGITGLTYLLDIANRDLGSFGPKILDYLSRTEKIIQNIIVPALVTDSLDQNLNRHRDLSLAALNRLAPLLGSTSIKHNHISSLLALLNDPSIDKKLLLSTLRCSGLEGQQLIVDLVRSKKLNENATAIALSTLSWRVPERHVLRIKTMEYTLDHCFLPGRLYQYEGTLQPWDCQSEHCPDTLCLSSRDFMSQLELYLKETPYRPQSPSSFSNCSLSLIVQILNLNDPLPVQLSQEVVMTLTNQLKNKSTKLRQIALLELGNIGQPQACISLDSVVRCLNDKESSLRSAACWTLAKIYKGQNKKIQSKLAEMLKDVFWKVRTSACIALGLITSNPQSTTIEALIKCLQDGSIPKPVICQSLAKMGAEQLLLQILKGTNRNDFKLREAVISSFQFSSLSSPVLNSIVEQVLKHSRDPRIQTRELSLLTLSSLRIKAEREKSQQNVTYFQSKHLLPFYYCFLDDPSSRIREIAAQNILAFGSQAELLFIQGMTKGQPLAKIECIRCLGRLGVQNFRAIILGLRDEDERVKRAAGQTILSNFSPEQIISQFKERQGHSISLICNLKQIMGQKSHDPGLLKTIKKVLTGLQGKPKCFSSDQEDDENVCFNC